MSANDSVAKDNSSVLETSEQQIESEKIAQQSPIKVPRKRGRPRKSTKQDTSLGQSGQDSSTSAVIESETHKSEKSTRKRARVVETASTPDASLGGRDQDSSIRPTETESKEQENTTPRKRGRPRTKCAPGNSRMFKCTKCDEEFSTNSELQTHNDSHHPLDLGVGSN
jgi:hypothetical protein